MRCDVGHANDRNSRSTKIMGGTDGHATRNGTVNSDTAHRTTDAGLASTTPRFSADYGGVDTTGTAMTSPTE